MSERTERTTSTSESDEEGSETVTPAELYNNNAKVVGLADHRFKSCGSKDVDLISLGLLKNGVKPMVIPENGRTKDVDLVSLGLLKNEIKSMVIPENGRTTNGSGLSNETKPISSMVELPGHAKTSDLNIQAKNPQLLHNLKPILGQSYPELHVPTSDAHASILLAQPSLPHTKQAPQQTTCASELYTGNVPTPEPSIVSPISLDQGHGIATQPSDEEVINVYI